MLDDVSVKPVSILSQRVEDLLRGFIEHLPNLLAAMVFLIVTWAAARGVRYVITRFVFPNRMRPALRNAITAIASVTIWLVGLLLAATIALPGLTPGEALAGLGIGSIAIGLAFKDIFENFLAGLMILMRKPMRIGDFIECEGITGKVETISLRDTYLRRTDGVLVMLPNAFLYKNPVRVLTDLDVRRTTVMVGIAYDEKIAEAQSVLEKALSGLKTIREDRPLQIFAHGFGASSIDFEVTWWTSSKPVDVRRSRDEVIAAIKSAFDNANIEIPFPYRTLTFRDPIPLQTPKTQTPS